MSGSDLIRPENDADPENVGATISEFYDELPADTADRIALREMFYHLRRTETAGTRELRSTGGESSDGLTSVYPSEKEWWTTTGSQYLALLPGVIPPGEPDAPGEGYLSRLSRAVSFRDSDSDTWRYVEQEHERPDVPADPTHLPDEYLDEALRDVAPDERQTPRSQIQLRKLYRYLVENETATSEDLKALYDTSRHDQHATGQYKMAGDWFREVGRDCLTRLPGIDAPRTAGNEWRYIGVDADELAALEAGATHPSDEEIEEHIAEIDVAGRGEWADRRRRTIRQMYDHLSEQGSVSESEFRSQVDASAVGFDSSEAFFDEIASGALADLPGVTAPDENTDVWEYDI